MRMRTVAALAALALFATAPLGSAVAEKKLTPQQTRMKECGAKWQEHKKSTGAKGNKAYRAFLGGCLKKA
jgi:hypothetical protein